MKLIERLYLAFYRFSLWQKENHPNTIWGHPRFDSILFLSFFTIFNVSSILKVLKIEPFITTHLFDCFLILTLIVSFLLLYLERNSRYKEIIEKHNTPSELGKIEILGWTYTILTIVFFFVVYKEIF